MKTNLEQFENQQYMNIETFRKNGQGIKTPAWFVREGNTLLIWTEGDSGKVKRIRRDGLVRISPSDAGGTPLGEWVNACANVDDSIEVVQLAEGLLQK